MRHVVLGSSSPFRSAILKKLNIAFDTHSPDIDESPLPNETPQELVKRLALRKAEAVAKSHPTSLIISSDQVSVLNGNINGKPGTRERAIAQLSESSNNTVSFYTSLCLYDALENNYQLVVEPYLVHFRKLSLQAIENYIDAESPLNCAGSFKSEGLGISLFNRLQGDDPNTLIGLPLIRLVEMLNKKNIDIP
ncbi:septum formation protein Maf [Gammaproteobacteria bacterium 45_16_T64]|nr:septum formation protein Maf [Gammaproteobacteria bacterium 45_16_T64]